MKVKLDSWLHRGRGKQKWNEYAVTVTDITTSGEDLFDFCCVHRWGRSKVEAEIYAEVFQHYIDTFPGAAERLRQAANPESDGADVPLVENSYWELE